MKQRLQILIEPDQLAVLKTASQKSGAPIAELIRRAVDDWIKRQPKTAK